MLHKLKPIHKKQKFKLKLKSEQLQISPSTNVLQHIEDDLQKASRPAVGINSIKSNAYKAKFLNKQNRDDLKRSEKTLSVGPGDLVNQLLRNFCDKYYLNKKIRQEQQSTTQMSNSTQIKKAKIQPEQQITVGVFLNHQKSSKNSYKKNTKKQNSLAIFNAQSKQQEGYGLCKNSLCRFPLTIENESTNSDSSPYQYCIKCKQKTSL